jgi:hypothetical protein
MRLGHVALLAVVLAAAVDVRPATAAPGWECLRGDGRACSAADLADSALRQILVMPAGYTEAEREAFWEDLELLIADASNLGSVWSTQKKDQILYVGYFTGGGALGTPEATFGGAVLPHPVRDYALTLSLDAVISKVNEIRASEIPELRPMGVAILFNDSTHHGADNASPPSFLFASSSYGVARLTRGDLRGGGIASHALAHAALNFLDEYVEDGFENLSIRTLDALNPLLVLVLVLDASRHGRLRAATGRLGAYDYNFSEILANNGNDNIATSPLPSTVTSPISEPASFPYEGGMFFGRGTFHAAGNNLMNSDHVMRADDDGFAFAHSASQQQLIDAAFGAPPSRANDRLRNAGPKNGWPGELGPTSIVLMFDGDKNHQFHRTKHYVVQVGWYERVWTTCGQGSRLHACAIRRWRTAQKTVQPTAGTIDLKASSFYGLSNFVQSVLCDLGVTELPQPNGPEFRLCERLLGDVAADVLPTFRFRTPYEETTVPTSQWFTTYYWRFSTDNGHAASGWTGWSSFYRSF